MIEETFLRAVEEVLPFPLTKAQGDMVLKLSHFLFAPVERGAYVLRGYAGTGKTYVISAVVRVLKQQGRDVVLLAPTGRAAKVLSQHAGFPAYTIHKIIYRQRNAGDINSSFDLDFNKHKDAVFIIDEASMVANDAVGSPASIFRGGQLLDDLIEYVYSGRNCRMILVGDNAQLPPVGEDESPALSPSALRGMGLTVSGYQLTTVWRQASESGILMNATMLREHLALSTTAEPPVVNISHYKDVVNLPGNEMVEALTDDYDQWGQEQVVVVTRSNKQAVQYNLGIRNMIFGREGGLEAGDVIMVVRNNYYWTEQLAADLKDENGGDTLPINFLANGDIAVVRAIRAYHEFYGLHFADVALEFPDYDYFEMDVRVVLDALSSPTPGLTYEQSQALYNGVMEDYADIKKMGERTRKLRLDPNYNAVQIKYAYAVTCHKAQGGQWRNVYIDQGWLPPDGIDRSYYRWLYTAFTRATSRLYLINWPEEQTK